MGTANRGNAAEAAVLSAFTSRGYDVFTPFGGGQPFDLAVHMSRSVFLRVQCKAAWLKGGCLVFNTRSTDHGRGPQSYRGLADVFGVYLAQRDVVYVVPIDAVAEFEGRLRLDPPLNNQRKGIRLAIDFEMRQWSTAMLGTLIEAPVEDCTALQFA
jgi:hypothetical protein